jgi:exo-beta-1,3-glucanase (GH17 family)
MQSLIDGDLSIIKRLGFSTIKTFYSTYCTISTGQCVNITQTANANGINVLLGVYEFPDHPDWTVGQVNAAIAAANAYPTTIVGIVVGNEDAFDWQGNPIPGMQTRIVNDMNTIRNELTGNAKTIKVLTAQRQPDWMALAKNDPQGLLAGTDIVGANIYPFWGNSPERGAAATIPGSVEVIAAATRKSVIVTEEGWPSCGNNPNTQDKTIDAEIDYYQAWKARPDSFDSYYFSAFDKGPMAGCANNDADQSFGLCTAAGTTKDARLATCD